MNWVATAGLIGIAVAAPAAAACAQSLEVTGTTGYLSEWQFETALTEHNDAFVGPVSWKHVGLCSVNGSVEKPGAIDVRIRRIGPWSRINAQVSFDQLQCSYSGAYSASITGFMECSDHTSLPLTLVFK